ncbi:MAG: ABC transporter ATP-binding protein [Candidatus Taylorbacteria bacterium]|nr:ABC transporter ATP-binding protein [Candidatus Taylorbacteria bacterium]
MIEIKNITKIYGKNNKVVDDLSLIIPTGTVFGFLGPNGAGKTTTIKITVGLNKPSGGSVAIGGQSPLSAPTRENIGFMPEEPRFYDELTGLELLHFASRLFKKSFPKTNTELGSSTSKLEVELPSLETILKDVGIYDARNEKIKYYSKGMKQRLGFAQALVNDPNYIFLDEPLEGLDPIGRREMKAMLEELKKQGKTIFFNSHILADVEAICDQIGIIHKGKLVYSGPVKEFRGEKTLEQQFVETIKQLGT